MAKRPAPKRKKTPKAESRRLRFWPALIIGLILVGIGILLWRQSSQVTFSDQLLRKLPKDSSAAGVARLSQFDGTTIQQVSQSADVDPARMTQLNQTLTAAGINRDTLKHAVDDQFAFAHTSRGDVAVFTVDQEADFGAAAKRLSIQVSDAKVVDRQTSDGTLKIWQANLNSNQQTIFAYRSGREFYLATNPELIASSNRETDGFTSLDQFSDISKQLPAGADAYLFLNVSQLPQPPAAFPLTGVAVTNQKDQLKLVTRVADPAVVSESLRNTTGKLLPGSDQASFSVEGVGAVSFLHLIEAQRQESDLPRVIALQNGIASLNRKLGIDLEKDIFGEATGTFVYARYRNADTSNQWFGAIEFKSAEDATAKTAQLTKLLRERITVPTRREILRNLLDGTQSREIVSEGNEALEITDIMVEGKGGNATTLPAMGAVNWVVDGKYLVLGSSPEAAARMVKTIASPAKGVGERGELAMRAKVSEVPGLLGARDGLFDWILAVQPESGTFMLNKSTGELQGAVRFKQAE